MNLAMAGINFRSTPVELREHFTFSSSVIPETTRKLIKKTQGAEIVLLSTCNRTELYAIHKEIKLNPNELTQLLLEVAKVDPLSGVAEHFYTKENLDAAEHLLNVASSLDSMVVGETEILGQIKHAYMQAVEIQDITNSIHTLFQKAITAAKRVQTETHIGKGRVSVSSIAIEFAEKVFDDLASKTVMIVGAGEMGEVTLKALVKKNVKDVIVINRSLHKGQILAERLGGRAIPFNLLEETIQHADIIISSTNAPHPIIRTNMLRRARRKQSNPILLIDIAVPRDIEEDISNLNNVYLCNIDDLQKLASDNLAKRHASISSAKKIIQQETADMTMLFGKSGLRKLLKDIDQLGQQIKETEIKKALKKESLTSLSDRGKKEVKDAIDRTVNRMLAPPRNALRNAEKNGKWEDYLEVIRDIFNIPNR